MDSVHTYSRRDEIDILDVTLISWRAIFGGVIAALLVYGLLVALGVGIGGLTLAGDVTDRAQGVGIGSAVWLVIANFIALFVGAWATAKVGNLAVARTGWLHGIVVSGVFFLVVVIEMAMLLGSTASGIGGLAGLMGRGGMNLAANEQVQSVVQNSLGDLGIQGDPAPVIRGTMTRLLRGDTEGAKSYLAQQTGRPEAEIEAKITAAQEQVSQTAQEIGSVAAKATAALGWTIFVVGVIGTFGGILGGVTGGRSTRKAYMREDLSAAPMAHEAPARA